MRCMGLDVGDKTIGVAVSDELGLTAQGVTTVRRKNLDADFAQLRAIVRERAVTRIVIGLPLNMDDSEGPRAKKTRFFARAVHDRLGLPIVFWDERLSTWEAERVLLAAELSRAERKAVVDKLAAQVILQSYLDAGAPEAGYVAP